MKDIESEDADLLKKLQERREKDRERKRSQRAIEKQHRDELKSKIKLELSEDNATEPEKITYAEIKRLECQKMCEAELKAKNGDNSADTKLLERLAKIRERSRAYRERQREEKIKIETSVKADTELDPDVDYGILTADLRKLSALEKVRQKRQRMYEAEVRARNGETVDPKLLEELARIRERNRTRKRLLRQKGGGDDEKKVIAREKMRNYRQKMYEAELNGGNELVEKLQTHREYGRKRQQLRRNAAFTNNSLNITPESDEQRKARLERDRIRAREKRSKETDEQRSRRKEADRLRRRRHRMQGTIIFDELEEIEAFRLAFSHLKDRELDELPNII